MPIGKYRGITLQKELVNVVEQYITTHPETGYKSLADFITDAVRKRCEELKILVPTSLEPPILEHFNVNQDHVTVIDRKRRMFADVYFRNNRVYCELCEKETCEHVKYTLNLQKVQKALQEKGWRIKEGKIIQRPH